MSYTKTAKPVSKKAGRFGFGTFGKARFDKRDNYDKTAKPATSYTKVAKP